MDEERVVCYGEDCNEGAQDSCEESALHYRLRQTEIDIKETTEVLESYKNYRKTLLAKIKKEDKLREEIRKLYE